MVERIVAAALRARNAPKEKTVSEDEDEPDTDVSEALVRILPYRAGYEAADRQEIQRALSEGDLTGLVSTSALEMGIDIGEIDTVVHRPRRPATRRGLPRHRRRGDHGEPYGLPRPFS